MIVAIDTQNLHPRGTIAITQSLWIALICDIVLALILIVACCVLSGTRRRPETTGSQDEETLPKKEWAARVNQVVARHDAQDITRDEAFAQLAAIARDFASNMSGRRMQANTLTDLRRLRRTGVAVNWDLLRQTIAALYPPEFAQAEHPQARGVSGRQAADWVLDLIERWQ